MKKLKKIRYYLLALILPLIICTIILASKNIFTNVENFFVTDLKMQHLPFLNYMKNILLGKTSLYYSFSAGMGSPMIATMIFYATSPINILLALIKDVQYAIVWIYICKISLAGLTMFIYLKNRRKEESIATVIFSTCYALCAFVINYFFCVFWFDVLYLSPLVMLGIDKIIEKGKMSLVYILSLALTIICNIQMGFGLCIFSVIYFIYSFNMKYSIKEDWKKAKNLGIIFAISSLCAGAISSGALLGFVAEYDKISAARGVLNLPVYTSNIGLLLKNLFTVGNFKHDYFNDFEPFIYCGLLVSFFSALYLFGSNKNKKRYHAILMMLIFLISISIKFINNFWHISNPVLLNYRYSVFFTAFINMIAYESYCEKNKLDSRDMKVMIIFFLIGLFMIVAYTGEVYPFYTFMFLTLIFTAIYLTKNKSKKFEIILFLIVLVEIGINGHLSIYTPSQFDYVRYTSYKKQKELASKNNFTDDYRVMYNYSYLENTNETILLNKNSSLRYFSSVIDGKLLNFLDRNRSRMGNNNYEVSAYDSPLLLSLLGNKYFYLNEEFNNSIYKKINTYKLKDYNYNIGKVEEREVYLYENPYALSIGYLINQDSKYSKEFDVVDYQNQMIKDFTGIQDNVITRVDYVMNENEELCEKDSEEECRGFEFTNETNNNLFYIYGAWDLFYTRKNTKAYFDTNNPLLITTLNRNVGIGLYYNAIEYEKYVISTYDEEKLIKSLSELQKNMLENIKVNKNIMTGNINAKKSGILLLTIPYEKKFNIYIDGKKTKYFPTLNNTFIGLNMESGEHKVKIEYIDNDLKWYIIASLSSLIITIVIWRIVNKKINKKQQLELALIKEKEEEKRKKQITKEKKEKMKTESKKTSYKSKKRK